MPFIPFPDVPLLAGVPALIRSAGQTIPIVTQQPPLAVAKNLNAIKWGIFSIDGGEVLIPDSFISFEYKAEQKIPTYPIEDGSFASYNKIALPFDLRLIVSCNGNGALPKSEFLSTIQAMQESLDVYDIVTPDDTYNNCNLIHYDYRRDAHNGISLITAQLWFQEVRIAQSSSPNTAQPDGADSKNNGQVSPIPSIVQTTNVIGN